MIITHNPFIMVSVLKLLSLSLLSQAPLRSEKQEESITQTEWENAKMEKDVTDSFLSTSFFLKESEIKMSQCKSVP